MPRRNLNYKSPFGFSGTVSMPGFKFRASEQAHMRLELNRLNTYIKKIQDRLSIFPSSKSKLGAHYRNLTRRLLSLKDRRTKLMERHGSLLPIGKKK